MKRARRWVALPNQYRLWMQPDSGVFPSMAARNGLIYHLAEYQEKTGAPWVSHLVVVREAEGTILASQPANGGQLYLWGDRAIVVTVIYHRPRAANAEVRQMFEDSPANLAPLDQVWHVNGNPPMHMATGGYEIPLLEAFADGIGFFMSAASVPTICACQNDRRTPVGFRHGRNCRVRIRESLIFGIDLVVSSTRPSLP